MDWCIDTTVTGAIDACEAEVVAHLRRHAEHQALVDLARPLVREVLTGSPPGLQWVSLDWEDAVARLSVRNLSPNGWPEPGPKGHDLLPVCGGVALAHQAIPRMAQCVSGRSATVELGVVRPPEPSIDPEPSPVPAGLTRETFLATTAAFMASEREQERSQEELAAWLGASFAVAGEEAFRERTGTERPLSAGESAEAFLELQRAFGADFFVVEQTDTRLVLGNRRCPFGDAVAGSPALCRSTSASMGRLAARAAGEARVTLDERIALGDHQCRLIVDLGPSPARPTSHHYSATPAGWAPTPGTIEDTSLIYGFSVSLSLRLPRDRLSVPVVRHLCRHALKEVGVVPQVASDVELALAEACGNVLKHSGPGDAYEVSITIGPVLCEIRVTDIGRGFDYESLTGEMAGTDAEGGRGIALMHALMDQVRFTSEPERGTIVHLVKQLTFDDDVPSRRLMLDTLERERNEAMRRSASPGA